MAIALPLRKNPNRARTGTIILAVLALISLFAYWSGAPAILGATAAWLAGLTKGGRPLTGVARGFGIVGFVVTVLAVVATLVGFISVSFH